MFALNWTRRWSSSLGKELHFERERTRAKWTMPREKSYALKLTIGNGCSWEFGCPLDTFKSNEVLQSHTQATLEVESSRVELD